MLLWWSTFGLLQLTIETHDLSQDKYFLQLLQAEQILKMTTVFTKNAWVKKIIILSENSCHFVINHAIQESTDADKNCFCCKLFVNQIGAIDQIEIKLYVFGKSFNH